MKAMAGKMSAGSLLWLSSSAAAATAASSSSSLLWPTRPGERGPIKKSFNQRQVWSAGTSRAASRPSLVQATSIIDRLFTVSQAMTLPIRPLPIRPCAHLPIAQCPLCAGRQFQEMQSSSFSASSPLLLFVNAVFDFASYATYINHQLRLLLLSSPLLPPPSSPLSPFPLLCSLCLHANTSLCV